MCEGIVAEQSLEGETLATVREALSAAQFGYDDVLVSRVLEEYESERARWARSAEKLRHVQQHRREHDAAADAEQTREEGAEEAGSRYDDLNRQRRVSCARSFIWSPGRLVENWQPS